ncbi:MAG: CPBP family intramembrane glutamic endopeptidase [Pseudomonadota bacterium]
MSQSQQEHPLHRRNVLERNEALLASLIWALFMLPILAVMVNALSYAHFYLHGPSAEILWTPWYNRAHPLSSLYWGYVILAAYFGLRFWLEGVGGLQASHKMGRSSPSVLMLAIPAVAFNWAFVSGLTALVLSITGESEIVTHRPGYEYHVTWANLLGWLVTGVVAAPLFEELAFRGFLFGCLLARGWSPSLVVVTTAAAFAITHVQYEPIAMFMVFVMGLIFGTLRLVSGGLLLPMVTHGLLNLTIFAADVS